MNILFSSRLSSLEQDVKRLKADLQANRQLESELRSQLSSLSSQDRSLRSELAQLRQDNELLQNKWVARNVWYIIGTFACFFFLVTSRNIHVHIQAILQLGLPADTDINPAWCSMFQDYFPLSQSRLHSAVQAKQKDKQTISQLEKRLKAEQEARAAAEKQLAEERKRKKIEEATAARAVALAAATRFQFVFFETWLHNITTC